MVGICIIVELNGFVIFDIDFGKVIEFMVECFYFGKDCLKGYFGFVGYSDLV